MGKTNFQTREFPRSGSKAKDGKEEREKERLKVITTASYALQTPPRVAHAKLPGPKVQGSKNIYTADIFQEGSSRSWLTEDDSQSEDVCNSCR